MESRERITFAGEVDRVYLGAPDRLSIRDEGNGRTIVIAKKGMADGVVWNPWIEKSKRIDDLGDEEYRGMVCVETGNIDRKIELNPDARWEGSTTFAVE